MKNIDTELNLLRQRIEELESRQAVSHLRDRKLGSGLKESIPLVPAGFPYGSTRWLWGVDILGTRVDVDGVSCPQIYIGYGAQMFRDVNTYMSNVGMGDVTVTIDMDEGYVYWTSNQGAGATDYGMITVATTLEATPYFREHYQDVNNYPTDVLYYVNSTTVNNVRSINYIVPYQFGPIRRPVIPGGDATYTKLLWNDGSKTWRVTS
jgi:hypothetical protein